MNLIKVCILNVARGANRGRIGFNVGGWSKIFEGEIVLKCSKLAKIIKIDKIWDEFG